MMINSKSRTIIQYTVILCLITFTLSFPLSLLAEALRDSPDGFILSRNETPQETYENAKLLYSQQKYKEALEMFNKVYFNATEPLLRRKALLAGSIVDSMVKLEKASPEESSEELANIERIERIQKKEQIAALYKEAFDYFNKQEYDKAKIVFETIAQMSPKQAKAKEYAQVKIPAVLKEEKIKALYSEAMGYFESKEYVKASLVFDTILSIDQEQQEAKEYAESKIPALLKADKIKLLYEEAIKYYEINDFQNAIVIFKNILSLDRREKQAREYIKVKIPAAVKQEKAVLLYAEAVAAYDSADYQKAAELFNSVLTLKPQDAGSTQYIEQKIPSAMQESRVKDLYEKAVSEYKNDNYQQASGLFSEIISIDPENKGAKEYLAVNIPAAMKQEKIRSLYAQAEIAYAAGEYAQAASLFKEILSLDNSQARAKEYLEVMIPENQKMKEIIALYTKAMQAYTTGEYDLALGLFSRIVAIAPEEEEAKEYLNEKIPAILRDQKTEAILAEAEGYFTGKEYEKATVAFETALSLDPKNFSAFKYLDIKIPAAVKEDKLNKLYAEATESYNRQDYEFASAKFNEIISLDPEFPGAKNYLEEKIPEQLKQKKVKSLYAEAIGLYDSGNYSGAEEVFKQLLLSAPDYEQAKSYLNEKIPAAIQDKKLEALHTEAMGYCNSREYDKAIVVFNLILSMDPSDKEAKEYVLVKIPAIQKEEKLRQLYSEAQQYYGIADYQKASQVFNQILEVDPQDKEAKEYAQVKIPQALQSQKINSLYAQAVQNFETGEYELATGLFNDILSIEAGNKEAKEYVVVKIPAVLKANKVQTLSLEAMKAYKAGEYIKSGEMFKEILNIDPAHVKAELYLNVKIPMRLEELKERELDKVIALADATAASARKQAKELAEPEDYPREGVVGYLYELALKSYRERNLLEAKSYFKKIIMLRPTESIARTYLQSLAK